jgi:hypothetical protein
MAGVDAFSLVRAIQTRTSMCPINFSLRKAPGFRNWFGSGYPISIIHIEDIYAA